MVTADYPVMNGDMTQVESGDAKLMPSSSPLSSSSSADPPRGVRFTNADANTNANADPPCPAPTAINDCPTPTPTPTPTTTIHSSDSFTENETPPYSVSDLEPPASRLELSRDWWFNFLDGRFHFWIGVIVMLLVIVDGALFFFMLIGGQNLCRPRTDCEPRNAIYNWSVQILNVLFSYLATISLPWRVANAIHLSHGYDKRQSTPGYDLYGQPTNEIWYHIREGKRRWVVFWLIANSLLQWANQATRIVYYSYELQDTFPGNVWTNVFFLSSMLCAAIGGFCQLHEEHQLRRTHPDRFPPGPLDVANNYLEVVCCICRCRENENLGETERGEEDQRQLEREENARKRCLSWLRSAKTSLDLWGI